MNERVLVTGATGFVGFNLVHELLSRGKDVRAFIKSDSKVLARLDIETPKGDVLDRKSLSKAMSNVDTVFHLAAVVSFDGKKEKSYMHRVNVEGTSNVVDECISSNVKRLVHFSSIHALSHLPLDEPIDESRELALGPGHLPYDRSKAEGECAVQRGIEAGLDAVIINPVWILGPNDIRPSPSGEFFLQLINRKLPAIVDAGYHCVDVRDVVNAAIEAASAGQRGHRYILPGDYATFRQLADWTQEVTGVPSPSLCLPIWMAAASAPVVATFCRLIGQRPLITSDSIKIVQYHQKIMTSKAQNELGFRSRSLKQSVCDTIHWLQQNHLNK